MAAVVDVATGAAVANNGVVSTVVPLSSTKDKGRTAAVAKLPPPRRMRQAPLLPRRRAAVTAADVPLPLRDSTASRYPQADQMQTQPP